MFRTISNGQSIYNYIPPDLKRMFYKNPAHIHASHNGLDPYGFSTDGLVLYLPLWALKDSAFKSVDAAKTTCTVTGATWTAQGRDFSGSDQNINIGLTTSTAGTLECWAKFDVLSSTKTADQCLFSPLVLLSANDLFYSGIGTTGAEQSNWAGTTPVIDTWYHYALTWTDKTDRTTEKLYINAALKARTNAGFATFAITYLGADTSGTARELDGTIGEARVYNRALSAGEVAHNRNCTKFRY